MNTNELRVLSRGYSVETGIAHIRAGIFVRRGDKWQRKELGYAEVFCATLNNSESALAQAQEIAFAAARKRAVEEHITLEQKETE